MRSWVDAALAPRSIAIIGASENPEKIGGRPIKYMLQHGYKGTLLPVNPGRAQVQGLPACDSVEALPEAPDMAVVCVPGEAAVQAVQDCARRGVALGVVISSGFAETGPEGRERQERMLAAARAGGMRLVGPNTQGVVNFGTGTIASFATLIGEVPPADGPVAIVSQSGAMSMVPYAFLRAQGVGVRHSHATGNECDLTVADFALAAANDPEVRVILLYTESIADPDTLARAARTAHERGVPVIALKAGVSERGQAAAASHTGAMATQDKVIDAYFRQNGILRVHSIQELVSGTRLLLQASRVRGRRLVAISNSGASCVMAADAAERHGLVMEPLAQGPRAAVEAALPTFASGANPIDLTAALLSNSALLSDVLPVLAEHDAAELCFVSLPMSGKGYDVPRFARDTGAFAQATGVPTVLASPLASTRQLFEEAGVPAYAHDEEAVAALGQLVRERELRLEAQRLRSQAGLAAFSGTGVGKAAAVLSASGGSRFLSESESLALLQAVGIPVVAHRLCTSEHELAAALAALPAPWVLKACSAAIPHKSELGLVELNIVDAEAALRTWKTLRARAREAGAEIDGILVAMQLRGRREILLGGRWDERLGAAVIVGDGGKYAEALPDVATLLYPFDETHVLQQLERLRIAPLLQGVRGEPPMPARLIAELAVRVGRWLSAAEGRIASVDVNPLMVGAFGVVAVDALVERGLVDRDKSEATG